MKLPRRRFLRLAAGIAAAPAVVRVARAQAYPARPVHLMVGFTAGGPTDITARLIGRWLSERLAVPFVIENRPGAGSNIATELITRAPADGYTLLLVGVANATNATLYHNLSFDFIRDVAPVAGIMRVPNVMEVNPEVPVRNIPELIAYAKADPGRLNMASGGNGTSNHVSGELFKMMTGVDMQHVPYRSGGDALAAVLGGQVQVTFESMASSIEYIKAGKLRALGVTSAMRSDLLPYVPAVGEFVPGYEASPWLGIGAPKNTPPEIIDKLNQAVDAILADPKMKAQLAELGGTPLAVSPAGFGALIVAETEKWAKVIRAANIKPE